MSEAPHMPSKDEILAKAIEMFKADRILKQLAPITPEEDELKEGNWFEKARTELMSGYKSQLEEYAAALESEAQSIRDELGIKPAPPTKDVRELMEEMDILSTKLAETRQKLREATAEIERLRAVKVPVKEVAPVPAIPKPPMCPVHGVQLIRLPEKKNEMPLPHPFPFDTLVVPEALFLHQCPIEAEYYICEPRKACQLIRLDRLKTILTRIVRPITAAPPAAAPGVRVVPRTLVSMEEVRAAQEEIERHPRFEEYITTMAYSLETFHLLDPFSKRALYEGFREWLRTHPFRELKRFS